MRVCVFVCEGATNNTSSPLLVVIFVLTFLFLDDRGSVRVTDLALDTDKVGNVTRRITERRNEELVPKGRTVDTVVEETHAQVVSGLNGETDPFDGLGVRLRSLQEAAVTTQNLVERIPRQVEEPLRRVDNRIVGQGRVRDDEVLLRRLEGLDEGKVGVVQDLVGGTLRVGDEDRFVGRIVPGRIDEFFGLVMTEMITDGITELFVLLLEEGDRLLEGFQQELLADAATLGVLTVAFAARVSKQLRKIVNNERDIMV